MSTKPTPKKDKLFEDFANIVGSSKDSHLADEIREEFSALTSGREKMSVKEAVSMKRYARLRADLEKKPKDLTTEEELWKAIYDIFNKNIRKMYGKDKKKELDDLDKLDKNSVTLIQAQALQLSLKDLQELYEIIEDALNKQELYISAHFDEENGYVEKRDAISEVMCNSKDPKESLEMANALLTMTDIHSEKILDPLFEVNDNLLDWLFLMEKVIEKAEDETQKTLLEKWYALTKKYYLNRRMQSNYVIVSNEVDRALPNGIIKNKGDGSKNMDASVMESMERYGLMTAVLNAKVDETDDLNKKRKKLAESIFTIVDNPPEEEKKSLQQTDKSTTKWSRYMASLMCIFGIGGTMDYDYYIVLRFVVFFVCGYYAYKFYKKLSSAGKEVQPWVWLLGGVAVVFNPFMPLNLGKDMWIFVDIVAAIIIYKSIKWERETPHLA